MAATPHWSRTNMVSRGDPVGTFPSDTRMRTDGSSRAGRAAMEQRPASDDPPVPHVPVIQAEAVVDVPVLSDSGDVLADPFLDEAPLTCGIENPEVCESCT